MIIIAISLAKFCIASLTRIPYSIGYSFTGRKPKKHMNKIIALDIGDVWTGIAVSDPLHILARPLTTVATKELYTILPLLIVEHKVATIIVGHPTTLRGTVSEQTKKVVNFYEQLVKDFPKITFTLWDERLSSKRAESLRPAKNKDQKIAAHARAAAFILDSYLQFLSAQKTNLS
jgi:putative Holliday junction resolvase